MPSLEEELQTQSFPNEHVKADLNVLFTANVINNRITAWLKPFGLSHEQYNVLRILRGTHPDSMCQKDVQCRMIARQSNLTLLIKKLKEKGMVNVKKSTEDKREHRIKINKKGLILLTKIDKYSADNTAVTSRLSTSEAFHLNALLDKLRR